MISVIIQMKIYHALDARVELALAVLLLRIIRLTDL
jgi:hypothetical protein